MNMKSMLTSWTLVAVVASGAVLHAQTPTPKAPKALAAAESEFTIRCPVGGLTPENASAVKGALTHLTAQVYACDSCKVEQAAAGKCSKCSATLQAAQRPLLVSVATAPAEASLTLGLNPRRRTSLAQIESALEKSGVHLDDKALKLPGRIILVIDGGLPEHAATLQKALVDAKVFAEVSGAMDAATSRLMLTARPLATPPTRAAVIQVLEGQKLRLADVLFENEPAAG